MWAGSGFPKCSIGEAKIKEAVLAATGDKATRSGSKTVSQLASAI